MMAHNGSISPRTSRLHDGSHRDKARERPSGQGAPWLLLLILPATLLAIPPTRGQDERSQPTLELFPSQAASSIRETSQSARELENNLQSVLADLEEQMQLYEDSGCEGSVDDQGCQEINSQMAATYGRMLDLMAEQLPEMKQNIEVTRQTLKTRLAEELGYGRTGAELQELLRERGGSSALMEDRTRPLSGGVRLSDRFRQYYRLVSESGGGTPAALVASRIYLDLEQTSELIELTEQQIQRGRMLANLSESFGRVTPQMEETISEVKTVMFGRTAAGGGSTGRVPQSPSSDERQQGFCSEFNPNC